MRAGIAARGGVAGGAAAGGPPIPTWPFRFQGSDRRNVDKAPKSSQRARGQQEKERKDAREKWLAEQEARTV